VQGSKHFHNIRVISIHPTLYVSDLKTHSSRHSRQRTIKH